MRIKALGNITPVALSESGGGSTTKEGEGEGGSALREGSRGMSRKSCVCLRTNQTETSISTFRL